MTEPETVTPAPVQADISTSKDVTTSKVVAARGLSKSFGQAEVVKTLDFDLGSRERVALIGPSGCGKTTVLRMVMGLERPTSGTVRIDGVHLWHRQVGDKLLPAREKDLRKVRSQVGMVFQQFNLFPHMTALQNVLEGPLHVRKLPKPEAVELARHMLDLVGLAQHMDKRPGQMSGGQQQRVGIARALAMQPKVMLFDEVTSSLDPERVGEVLRVIREIADSTEIAMIIVTHEMRFAERMADRVLMFDGGQVVEEGPASQIFHNPREERTRKFLNALHQE
jgi:polar amino acid transport system ATP-binding protein